MFRHLLVVGLILTLPGCALAPIAAPQATTPSFQDDPSRPMQARWLRTELYFALGQENAPTRVSEQGWRRFLDQEVTPRFPDGFTVFDAYGQWRDLGASAPEQLKSKVIIILHEDSPSRHNDLEAIRLAWKRSTGDLSVLRLSQPAQVSF